MKFKIGKASNLSFEEVREISTLEELLDLISEFDSGIVVHEPMAGLPGNRITIYDDYLE